MGIPIKQPERFSRKRRRAGCRAVFVCAVLVCTAVWHWRVAVVSRAVRYALNRYGWSDLSFRITRLSAGAVSIADLQFGETPPLLSVARIDLRFSFRGLRQRRVDHISVYGLRTAAAVENGRLDFPLLRRFGTAAPAQQKTNGASNAKRLPSLDSGMLRDARIEIRTEADLPPTDLTAEADIVREPSGPYRIWLRGGVDRALAWEADAMLNPASGSVSVNPRVSVRDAEAVFEWANRLIPGRLNLPAGVFPTNCNVTAQGCFSVSNWTRLEPFSVHVESGRNLPFFLPEKDAFVRFQSFRADVSGTPDDLQCRVSAGVSGFRFPPHVEASQTSGRLLSVRGTARFREQASRQQLSVAVESDLPGRSLARVLPRLLPLVPIFFSDGGTLKTEAELSRPHGKTWHGQIAFAADAARSSAPLAVGRVGAGAVRISGTVAVSNSVPGPACAQVSVDDGFLFRPGMAVKGGVKASLSAAPPYVSAVGTFTGHVEETLALRRRSVSFANGEMPFTGRAVVTGLSSNPVWQIALRVPEFGVSSSTGASVRVQATAGAAMSMTYSPTRLAAEGEVWARDIAVAVNRQDRQVGTAGVSRVSAHFRLPATGHSALADAAFGMCFGVSNGWARIGDEAVLEDARCDVPFSVSRKTGLSFPAPPVLQWRRLDVQGLRVEPSAFALTSFGDAVGARLSVSIAESQVAASLRARIPVSNPERVVVGLTVPATAVTTNDAVAKAVHRKFNTISVAGRIEAEAECRLADARPSITGRARLAEGVVQNGKVSVEGVKADVPFEYGNSFRTIGRPTIAFDHAKAGNIRIENGRVMFQVYPDEVFIDRMEVGWCKGSLNAYSIHLNFTDLRDDFIIYADRIDLGDALMMVMPFRGEMNGLLYGRFPIGFDNGKVKLSTGFLYSLPGEGGRLRLDDPSQMQALLDKSGIHGEVQMSLAKALSNMDFNSFKIDLDPGRTVKADGKLSINMKGQSKDSDWPAPVDLTLNLHGPLEQLLNMGLKVSHK